MPDERLLRIAWRETLARKYPTEMEARDFVDKVGLRPERIAFQPRADLTWFSIFDEARKQGGAWTERILDQARTDFPGDAALDLLRRGAPVAFPDGHPASWQGRGGAMLEKVTGRQSALVPISFLEKGIRCAAAVVRVRRSDHTFGSGFVIEGNLLVTNHHVLGDKAAASSAAIEFNVQRTVEGLAAQVASASCDPGAYFLSSASDDFTIVRLAGAPETPWPALRLELVTVEAEDRVNIIQHPGGSEKQLSYFHNIVAFVGGGRVQYLTDTMPGSSGSPVFDKDWRVVAVHHSGGWIAEPGVQRRVAFRNEGIHIQLVLDALCDKPPPRAV